MERRPKPRPLNSGQTQALKNAVPPIVEIVGAVGDRAKQLEGPAIAVRKAGGRHAAPRVGTLSIRASAVQISASTIAIRTAPSAS